MRRPAGAGSTVPADSPRGAPRGHYGVLGIRSRPRRFRTLSSRHFTFARPGLPASLRRLLALSAALAALGVAGPVSGASAAILPGGVGQGGQANAPSACVGANAPSGVGDAGATSNQVCGAILVFVGPSAGQIATAIGPTIIGSTIVAPITVSPGPVAVSGLP
jgi:hypothetical protein